MGNRRKWLGKPVNIKETGTQPPIVGFCEGSTTNKNIQQRTFDRFRNHFPLEHVWMQPITRHFRETSRKILALPLLWKDCYKDKQTNKSKEITKNQNAKKLKEKPASNAKKGKARVIQHYKGRSSFALFYNCFFLVLTRSPRFSPHLW